MPPGDLIMLVGVYSLDGAYGQHIVDIDIFVVKSKNLLIMKSLGKIFIGLIMNFYKLLTQSYVVFCFYYWFIVGNIPLEAPSLSYFEIMGILLFVQVLTFKSYFSKKQVDEQLAWDSEYEKRNGESKFDVNFVYYIALLIIPWCILGIGKLYHLLFF